MGYDNVSKEDETKSMVQFTVHGPNFIMSCTYVYLVLYATFFVCEVFKS